MRQRLHSASSSAKTPFGAYRGETIRMSELPQTLQLFKQPKDAQQTPRVRSYFLHVYIFITLLDTVALLCLYRAMFYNAGIYYFSDEKQLNNCKLGSDKSSAREARRNYLSPPDRQLLTEFNQRGPMCPPNFFANHNRLLGNMFDPALLGFAKPNHFSATDARHSHIK